MEALFPDLVTVDYLDSQFSLYLLQNLSDLLGYMPCCSFFLGLRAFSCLGLTKLARKNETQRGYL